VASIATWTVNQYALVAVVAGVVGFLGYKSGLKRALILLLVVLATVAVVGFVTDSLVEPINRLDYLMAFARRGGLSAQDPSGVWREVTGAQGLIQTDRGRNLLKIGLFAGIVLLGYALSARSGQARGGAIDGVLGFATGIVTGVALSYFLLPILFPAPGAAIQVSTVGLPETVVGTVSGVHMVIVLVVAFIAYGLYMASRRSRGQG
jgi:hypothetical protein